MTTIISDNVLQSIRVERERQDGLWGQQNHDPGAWLAILTEEVGETAKEVVRRTFEHPYPADLATELIHVAAVAIQWLEALERAGELE